MKPYNFFFTGISSGRRVRLSVLFLLFTTLSLPLRSAVPNWEFKINVGYSIGGTSPLPLPEEVRKIESFIPPAFSPHIALEGIYKLNEKWGISAQIALDHKGFEVKNRVKNLYTEMEMKEEKYIGNFTGKNSTKIRNQYLSLPISATWFVSEKWLVQGGFYVALLTESRFKGTASDGYIRRGSPIGEKTTVDLATFDFSDNQNRFDFGMVFAGEWAFSNRFALRGGLTWGLRPLFPSGFTGIPFRMYNIYGTAGISYRL